MSEAGVRTFMDACLSGDAFLGDIDDWVAAWHDSEDESVGLDSFLGFSEEEGALWAERPEALRFIVAAHRREVPLMSVMAAQEDWALAARAGNEQDARAVVAWLRQTQRL